MREMDELVLKMRALVLEDNAMDVDEPIREADAMEVDNNDLLPVRRCLAQEFMEED